MPARQRKRFFKRSNKSRQFILKKTILVICLLLAPFLYLLMKSEYWDGKSKLSLVINNGNEVQISVFDPEIEEITTIVIPGDTEVNLSRQLGTWKIKSVWQLGENEGVEGELLAETVTRYLKFPTTAWADKDAASFSEGNFASLLKAVIIPYKTNLKIGDRVKIALFSLGIKNTKRVEINLEGGGYLKKAILADGKRGYIKADAIPQYLAAIFTEPEISKQRSKVQILNASGNSVLAEEVGKVIEVLGAKVTSITKENLAETDCQITGKSKAINQKLGRLFNCEVLDKMAEGSFDLEIRIGSAFLERY